MPGIKITICGDTCPTSGSESLFANGDVAALFGDVTDIFKQSDRVIVNLECALSDGVVSPIKKMGPCLKSSVKSAKTLADAGVTDCSLSNNHIFDYGTQGIRDTIKALNENGLFWTGVGENEKDSRRNHMIKIKDKKIAVIAVCEHEYTYALDDRMGARPYDPYDTMADIRAAKRSADFVIVLYHGGKEQCEYPSPRLRKLCQAMAQKGADIVICQHSHCIGCYEEYLNSHILYGQGNFHFVNYIDHPHWLSGLVVGLDIDEKINISFIPVVVKGNGIDLAKDDAKDRIMKAFNERNEILKNGKWKEKWHEFCVKNSVNYMNAISNAFTEKSDNINNELFSHYLDCEAHTDVWREILPTWNHTNEKNL